MKFQITITDATAEDLHNIGAALIGQSVMVAAKKGVSEVTPAPITTEIETDDNEPVNTNAPEVDANGVPWDARIHSASKAINANGSWRRVRGITDEEFNRIEAELKSRNVGQPTPDNSAPVQSAPAAIPTPPAGLTMETAAAAQQPHVAATPQAAPTPTPQPVAAPVQPASAPVEYDFAGFMQAVMQAMGNGSIDNNYLTELCKRLEINTIPDLQANHVKLGEAVALLRAEGKIA